MIRLLTRSGGRIGFRRCRRVLPLTAITVTLTAAAIALTLPRTRPQRTSVRVAQQKTFARRGFGHLTGAELITLPETEQGNGIAHGEGNRLILPEIGSPK